MSRGPGQIQRFIVETVTRRKGEIVPVAFLAYLYRNEAGGYTPHLRASFRRAATRLEDEGAVKLWYVWAPTRRYEGGEPGAWREVLCVGPPDITELTDEMIEVVQLFTS